MPSILSSSYDHLENKARSEFDRDRQRAIKSSDARKRLSPHHQPTSIPPSPKRQSLVNWKRNSFAFDDAMDGISHFEDEFTEGKENSRPASIVSVSLEELVVVRSSPTKKGFSTQFSRTSISRQASSDSLSLSQLSLSPPSLSLPPISELQPMLCPYHSESDSEDEDDLDNFDELLSLIDSAPGADEWAQDDLVGGHRRLRSLTTSDTTVLLSRAEW